MRQNRDLQHCSAIFLSLHLGHQLVIWEATNYPKLCMKLCWFYVMHDYMQPFCAAELPMMHKNSQLRTSPWWAEIRQDTSIKVALE